MTDTAYAIAPAAVAVTTGGMAFMGENFSEIVGALGPAGLAFYLVWFLIVKERPKERKAYESQAKEARETFGAMLREAQSVFVHTLEETQKNNTIALDQQYNAVLSIHQATKEKDAAICALNHTEVMSKLSEIKSVVRGKGEI